MGQSVIPLCLLPLPYMLKGEMPRITTYGSLVHFHIRLRIAIHANGMMLALSLHKQAETIEGIVGAEQIDSRVSRTGVTGFSRR